MKAPVVFTHGMFMNSICWQEWLVRFGDAVRSPKAPDWPRHVGTIAELRARHPDPELGKAGLTDVVEAMADTVALLSAKPVLVGHSMRPRRTAPAPAGDRGRWSGDRLGSSLRRVHHTPLVPQVELADDTS